MSSVPKTLSHSCESKIVEYDSEADQSYPSIQVCETIFAEVQSHNIQQLNNVPKTNRKLTTLFLSLFVIGLIAGMIGIGALLPQLGVIKASNGIIGIPLDVSIALAAIGTITIVSMGLLKIASKKSTIAKEYLKDILKMRSQTFLESNLNDFANIFIFTLAALTFLHSPWITTLKGCLNYPCGILIIGSAIYQIFESCKSFKNAKQINNKEQHLISILNIISSLALLSYGAFTVLGKFNCNIAVYSMFICQALRIVVAGIGMKNSYKTIKKLYKIKNTKEIIAFLKNHLELNNEEIETIKNKIKDLDNVNILKWIRKNKNKWKKEQQQKWEEKYEIEKIKKLILNEEIKNAVEQKYDSLRFLLKQDTFKETLNIFEKIKNNNCTENELKIFFKKVKKEITFKTIAELIKILILYTPFTVIPFLKTKGLINVIIYDYLFAFLCAIDLGVNITPRFRNVPPALQKKTLDINKKISGF